MGSPAQKKATDSYRARLTRRGLKRFEVLAPESDRDLIRSLARQLAEDGPEAEQARAAIRAALAAGDPPRSGGILSALRRSPLVGADLDLSRAREGGRRVNL